MKKIQFLIIAAVSFFILSCEKEYSELIDAEPDNFLVMSVSPSSPVIYNALDSLIIVRINFSAASKVSGVSFDILNPDNTKLNTSPIELADNGRPEFGDDVANDNRYSNKFPMSSFDPVGTYSIRYYALNNSGEVSQVAQSTFNYDNGQDNVAPVISNLIIPDQVAKGVSFIFSVEAIDENGLNDIQIVFFELFRPDGSQVEVTPGNTRFLMHDDGNFEIFGDEIAGDGIYSYKNSFGVDATIGIWRFEFQALDRGGLLSNKITHNILVE